MAYKDPEKARAYQKAYRAKHKERLNQRQRVYRDNNRDKVNAWARDSRSAKGDSMREYWNSWYDNNKDAARSSRLKYAYGISLEEYNAMNDSQNGLCAICGEPETALNNRRSSKRGEPMPLCVDHCHITGQVRQLLCRSCNMALGAMKDSPALFLKAAEYLERHQQ